MTPLLFTTFAEASEATIPWSFINTVISTFCAVACTVMAFVMRAMLDRFQRGDEEFKELHRKQAEIAVHHAMSTGDLQVMMRREFVTREEFDRRNERYDDISQRLTRLTTLVEQWMERDKRE